MRIYALLFFCLILNTFSNSFAQDQRGCGTVYTEKAHKWRLENAHLNNIAAKLDVVYYVPVKFHLFGNSNSTGFFQRSNLLDILAKLNWDYRNVGFRFYIAGNSGCISFDSDIDRIANDYFFNGQYSDRNELFVYNVDGAFNAYIMNQKTGLCGRANFPGDVGGKGDGGIELIDDCLADNNSTFSHEAGHWFSLPHPFNGWCDECEDGSNCLNCGDGFCDTRADYYSDRWDCGNPPNELDRCNSGIPISPQLDSLIMSYCNDECGTKFSYQQINGNVNWAGMIATLSKSSARSFLFKFTAPTVVDTIKTTPKLLLPKHNDTISAEDYTITWSSVPNATMYHLMISKSSQFSSSILVDYFTADTFYQITTAQGFDSSQYRHYWKVKPFNCVYTAAAYTVKDTFFVGGPNGLTTNLSKLFDIQIYPNPLSGRAFHLNINTDKNFFAKGLIYNVTGQLIQSENFYFTSTNNNQLITLPEKIPAGIYVFHLLSNEGNFIKKLVVLE